MIDETVKKKLNVETIALGDVIIRIERCKKKHRDGDANVIEEIYTDSL